MLIGVIIPLNDDGFFPFHITNVDYIVAPFHDNRRGCILTLFGLMMLFPSRYAVVEHMHYVSASPAYLSSFVLRIEHCRAWGGSVQLGFMDINQLRLPLESFILVLELLLL